MSLMIDVQNLSKDFRFWADDNRSLKKVLVRALKGQLSLGHIQSFNALKNVSFQIHSGEFVGIMGRNGAGKSTLLKLLSGIYTPTRGTIQIHGKIAPLIELGAGFHGDLTGEENIFLNASILGFGREASRKAVPKILEFSELGDFIKMPVKTYSSGMVVRLGFSIAAHLDTPILLLDEILAVGDTRFQEKCLEKITQSHKQGRTIVLITHEPKAVAQFCSRCIIIDHHEKVFDGTAPAGVDIYKSLMKDAP